LDLERESPPELTAGTKRLPADAVSFADEISELPRHVIITEDIQPAPLAGVIQGCSKNLPLGLRTDEVKLKIQAMP